MTNKFEREISHLPTIKPNNAANIRRGKLNKRLIHDKQKHFKKQANTDCHDSSQHRPPDKYHSQSHKSKVQLSSVSRATCSTEYIFIKAEGDKTSIDS
jgi:hypothetical protein